MKTPTTSMNIRNIIAGLTLSAAFFLTGSVSAQSIKFADNAAIHTQTTDGLKVAVFPVSNTLFLKVNIENPSREKVTVFIKNSHNDVVYKKSIGNAPVFNGKFDVSKIVDGSYTIVIESASQSYANPFSIDTYQERIAKAL